MTDKIGRFGNLERERVIDAIQSHYGVTLRKVGRRPKWRRDETGRNWWVLGGREDWHGIAAEMMDDEIASSSEGMLVIAQKKIQSIETFAGALPSRPRAHRTLPRGKELQEGAVPVHRRSSQGLDAVRAGTHDGAETIRHIPVLVKRQGAGQEHERPYEGRRRNVGGRAEQAGR